MEHIGRTLRVLRTFEGLSQRRVAKKLSGKISDQTISNWEQGAVEPEEGNLRQLLKVYGLSLMEFGELDRVVHTRGEDAMLADYVQLKQGKQPIPTEISAQNAADALRWIAALDDGERGGVLELVADEDARMVIWALAQKIKPLPVQVKARVGQAGRRS